jgi:hypothetical protein
MWYLRAGAGSDSSWPSKACFSARGGGHPREARPAECLDANSLVGPARANPLFLRQKGRHPRRDRASLSGVVGHGEETLATAPAYWGDRCASLPLGAQANDPGEPSASAAQPARQETRPYLEGAARRRGPENPEMLTPRHPLCAGEDGADI